MDEIERFTNYLNDFVEEIEDGSIKIEEIGIEKIYNNISNGYFILEYLPTNKYKLTITFKKET